MKEIGGYFELELNKREEYYPNAVKLNSGRNALLYILKAYKPSKIFVPYYICDAALEPIIKMNVKFEFYHINKDLEPEIPSNFQEGNFFLYVNYFGINNYIVKRLAKKINNLITDNSQAFYSPPIKFPTFYSPRKFFGVPDGAYLFTDIYLNEELEQSFSYEKFLHLIKRYDLGSQKGYEDYKQVEALFSTEPLKRMSNLTENILSSLDYEKIKLIREKNFFYIHNKLKKSNELKINTQKLNGPMKYPLLIAKEGIKEFLIKNNIFVSSYWQEVFKRVDENSHEYYLTKYLIPLPIDQRYNLDDMNIVIEKIKDIL